MYQFASLGIRPEGISIWENQFYLRLQKASISPEVHRTCADRLCQVEIPEATLEIDLPVVQIDQGRMAGVEEMMRQMQETMKIIQEDAARQAEFAKQQAAIMAQQAELIARLQQQAGASASHQAPPPSRVPILGEAANGVKCILDIEDGYTDSAVTLPDRFKMPHIDRFDGSGDPMVHLHLFSDILRPMGLTTAQKMSLFGRTMSGIAAIWYAKLEDSVKQNWEELAEAFIAQYSYNTQIEITTRDL
ncbi:hypothetical protein ACSBR1_009928 [Camellia fascicularis]